MSDSKWKTKKFTITGWICISLVLLVVGIDIWLACDSRYPTISQYVTSRWQDQPLFGYIIIACLIGLGAHWFYKRKDK